MSEIEIHSSTSKRSFRNRVPAIGRVLLVAVSGGLLLAAGFVWRTISRNISNTTACVENVKKIVLALHNYHDSRGCFPPAYFADKSGKPAHSWRVLLLPFLGEHALYEKYRFDEAWDGPHNSLLAAQMPTVFQCPADREGTRNTSYVVVTGEGTTFPGARSRRISDLLDGPRNTILFVEIADSGINWMEPRDLSYEQALAGINLKSGGRISSQHAGLTMAATADGSIWALPNSLSRDTLRKLLLCNDGEIIPDFGSPTGSATEPAPPSDEVRPRGDAVFK